MSSRVISIIAVLILSIGIVYPNGLSLNSVGPKAFGMGGAFVGLANDYTAIYWNPAGLTQIQKNFVGVFATDVIPMGTYKYSVPAYGINIDTKEKTNHYISPNLMGLYHFGFSENLTFGLGIYVPAGIGSEWEGNDLKKLNGGHVVEWMSKVAVFNISPTAAYKFSDNVSVGLAVNIFYGTFDLKKPGGSIYQYSENSKGLGYGVTLGAMYKLNEMFSFGASFRTKTTVKMSGSADNPLMTLAGHAGSSDFDRDIAWPMWISGGVAYHPMNNLVVTLDAQYSAWASSEDVFTTVFKDAYWVAATSVGGANLMTLNWKDAIQIRVGADYGVNDNLDVRAGFYVDPAPAPDETYSILFPSLSYTGITLGAGYKVNDFVFDLGVEYLIGKDRDIAAATHAMPGTYGMNVASFSLGVGYQF